MNDINLYSAIIRNAEALGGMTLWKKVSFQSLFKHCQGVRVDYIVWQWVPNSRCSDRESTAAKKLFERARSAVVKMRVWRSIETAGVSSGNRPTEILISGDLQMSRSAHRPTVGRLKTRDQWLWNAGVTRVKQKWMLLCIVENKQAVVMSMSMSMSIRNF